MNIRNEWLHLLIGVVTIFLLLNSCSNNARRLKTNLTNDKIKGISNEHNNSSPHLEMTKFTDGFQSINLPGGTPSVSIRRIGEASDGSLWTAVRIPQGFSRETSVFLNVEESYITLEGELLYSGIQTPTNSYTIIPAGAARTQTRTNKNVLAIARFSKKPMWLKNAPVDKKLPIKSVPINANKLELGPIGPWHFILNQGDMQVGYLKNLPQQRLTYGCIFLSLSDHIIVEVLKDDIPPQLKGPILAWVLHVN